jgi:hypothetical protein
VNGLASNDHRFEALSATICESMESDAIALWMCRGRVLVWSVTMRSEHGIAVFGAVSIGALRAAELDDFGMPGIGWIYEWFRDGVLQEDDEVAVLHGPPELDFMPLTGAVANVRATIADAMLRGAITRDCAEEAIHYKERIWETLASEVMKRTPRDLPEGLAAPCDGIDSSIRSGAMPRPFFEWRWTRCRIRSVALSKSVFEKESWCGWSPIQGPWFELGIEAFLEPQFGPATWLSLAPGRLGHAPERPLGRCWRTWPALTVEAWPQNCRRTTSLASSLPTKLATLHSGHQDW